MPRPSLKQQMVRRERERLLRNTNPTAKWINELSNTFKRSSRERNSFEQIFTELKSFYRSGDVPPPRKLHDPTLDMLWVEVTNNLSQHELSVNAADWQGDESFLYRDYLAMFWDKREGLRRKEENIKTLMNRVPPASSLGQYSLGRVRNVGFASISLISNFSSGYPKSMVLTTPPPTPIPNYPNSTNPTLS